MAIFINIHERLLYGILKEEVNKFKIKKDAFRLANTCNK